MDERLLRVSHNGSPRQRCLPRFVGCSTLGWFLAIFLVCWCVARSVPHPSDAVNYWALAGFADRAAKGLNRVSKMRYELQLHGENAAPGRLMHVRRARISRMFGGDPLGDEFGGGSARDMMMPGSSREPRSLRVPISILCGFLGAGKTSLVQHILRNREGLKVGVVVNDVAETNIDSEMLKFEDADGIMGLQNGCACCSGRDDLFTRLEQLASSKGVSKREQPWDRMVVECSGIAEPEGIAREFEALAAKDTKLMKRVFLAGIVCVIDADAFESMMQSEEKGGSTGTQPLSVLLSNQIESSDTIVINKVDIVDEAQLQRVESIVKALSPNARLFRSTKGALPLRSILPAEPIDLDMPAYVPSLAIRHSVAVTKALEDSRRRSREEDKVHSHGQHVEHNTHAGHACTEDCTHDHDHHQRDAPRHAKYGITSFVYRRDRPFRPDQLEAAVRQLPVASASLDSGNLTVTLTPSAVFAGVLRSKGFVAIEGHPKSAYWAHAGKQFQLQRDTDRRASLGQELVFIGMDMDEAAIARELDRCLGIESEVASPRAT